MKLMINISEQDFHRVCQRYIDYSDTLEGRCLVAISEGVPEEVISLDGENIALAFQLGIAFGFAKRYDEMDKIIEEIKKAVAPQKESEESNENYS